MVGGFTFTSDWQFLVRTRTTSIFWSCDFIDNMWYVVFVQKAEMATFKFFSDSMNVSSLSTKAWLVIVALRSNVHSMNEGTFILLFASHFTSVPTPTTTISIGRHPFSHVAIAYQPLTALEQWKASKHRLLWVAVVNRNVGKRVPFHSIQQSILYIDGNIPIDQVSIEHH